MAPDSPATPDVVSQPKSEQVFRMEPEYYIGTYFLVLLCIGLIVIGYLPLLFSYLAHGNVYLPLQRAVMYMSGTFFILLLLARFGRKEMDAIRFIITDHALIRTTSLSTIAIPFSDMSGCLVRTFPLIKGFVKVTGPNRSMVLPSTIRHFGDMVEALLEKIAQSGRGDLCGKETTDALRRIALIAAFSQARSRACFFPLIYGTVLSALADAFIAGVIWRAGNMTLVIWVGFGLIMPLLVYGLADFRLNRSTERQLKRDPAGIPRLSLKSEVILSSLVVFMVYAIAGIFFKAFLPS
jgi:hypothetical protein